jgi:hypothetical protein
VLQHVRLRLDAGVRPRSPGLQSDLLALGSVVVDSGRRQTSYV